MFDPISIGLMLAGAAITAKGQNSALKKQNNIAMANQRELLSARNEATKTAMDRAMEFSPEDRQARQDQIAQQLQAEYQPAVQGNAITAQGVQVGTTIPTAAGTTDYLAAQARERTKSTESLRTLAQLMGRIGSAGQLRRDEAVDLGDTADQIGRIQGNASNLSEIESIRANAVTPSLGSQLIGGALSSYGAGRMAGAGVGGTATKKVFSTSYANPDMRDLVNLRGSWN